LRSGEPIPGHPELRFVGSVLVDRLQYRSKFAELASPPAPVLLDVQNTTALLEIEIAQSAAQPDASSSNSQSPRSKDTFQHSPTQTGPALLNPSMFDRVQVNELDSTTYELQATSALALIEHVGQTMAALSPLVTSAYTSQTGMGSHFSTSVADVNLSHVGFQVTNLKIAQTFGVQVGDLITRINGNPVNSPLNAWWTFQEILVRNPLLSDITIELWRGGKHMIKTYRIR
jgi:hypothetical protein